MNCLMRGGFVQASLSKGCQALAELNQNHRRLARRELLSERPLRSNPDPDPDPGPGGGSKGRPATGIQVTPIGVIEYVETPLLPPARHSPKRLPLESAKVHHEGSTIALPTWTVERLVIPRARPLPRRWGKRSRAVSIPKVRPLPHQWASQGLSRCFADGERDQIQIQIPENTRRKGSADALPTQEVTRTNEIQSDVHPKGSAVASPMGKITSRQEVQSNAHPTGSAVASPMGKEKRSRSRADMEG
jgi:hypothetical protein